MPYKDPEKHRQYQREYRKNNPEKIAKYEAKYRKNNREKLAKKQAEWKKNNPEKIAEYHKNNQEKIAKKAWFKKYGGTEEQYNHYLSTTHCECCDVELTRKESRKSKLTDKCQDHCHDTGKIRGVICNACNSIEGLAKVKERLELMLQYCKKYNIKKENPNALQRS